MSLKGAYYPSTSTRVQSLVSLQMSLQKRAYFLSGKGFRRYKNFTSDASASDDIICSVKNEGPRKENISHFAKQVSLVSLVKKLLRLNPYLERIYIFSCSDIFSDTSDCTLVTAARHPEPESWVKWSYEGLFKRNTLFLALFRVPDPEARTPGTVPFVYTLVGVERYHTIPTDFPKHGFTLYCYSRSIITMRKAVTEKGGHEVCLLRIIFLIGNETNKFTS